MYEGTRSFTHLKCHLDFLYSCSGAEKLLACSWVCAVEITIPFFSESEQDVSKGEKPRLREA